MKKITLIFIAIFPFHAIFGQTFVMPNFVKQMSNPTKSFIQIQSEANNYFDSLKLTNGGVITSQEKDYKRWEYFWKDRSSYPGAPYGGDFTKVMEYSKLLATNSINICNTSPGASSWQLQGPTTMNTANMGIVISVAMDPTNSSIIYAGSNTGGLWKTTNGNSASPTWYNIADYLRLPCLGVASIAIDKNNVNIIYIATGSYARGWASYAVGVLKSTDGGVTWNSTSLSGNAPNGNKINIVKIDPSNSNNIYAAGGKTISKSFDGGSTWTTWTNPSASDVSFRDLEFDRINSNIVYASTDVSGIWAAEFWVSMDGGISWNNRTPAGTTSPRIAIAVTQADINNVYLLYRIPATTDVNANGTLADDTYITIKKSSDNGNTWSLVSSIYNRVWAYGYAGVLDGIGYWKNEFEISPYNANVMYAGGDVLNKSTNGGVSFSAISAYSPPAGSSSTHGDIRALSFVNGTVGTDAFLIGHDGGIALSNNAGVNWSNLNGNGLAITQFYGFDDFQNNEDLVGGTQDNGTLKKNNGIWTNVSGGDGGRTIVDDLNPNIVYGNQNGSVIKSSNGGSSFPGYLGNPNAGWYLGIPMYLDPTNHSKLWYGLKNLYYHNGTSWVTKWTNPNTSGTTGLTAIAVAKSNPQVMCLAYGEPTWGNSLVNKFFKSTDGGTTFTDISSTMPAYTWAGATDIVIDPKNENHFFVSFSSFWPDGSGTGGQNRVIESTNGGATWNDISNGLTPFPVNCLTYQEGTNDIIYAGTDVGVYRWNKSALTWECYNKDLPVSVITHLEINYCSSKIKASTYGRGIWQADLASVNEYHITATQTWLSGTFNSFNSNVIVDGGKVLTIKGTVSFAPGIKLIVMPNAKLIIDGGKLTNSCGNLWEGIQVVGTTTQPQTLVSGGFSPYQGIVDIKNNAIIENAHTAIFTGLTNSSGTIDFNTFGGIIYAVNSKFLNNNRDVAFMSYPNYNNRSYFKNCKFDINSSHATSLTVSSHISMWNVKNINILGCDFSNSVYAAFPIGTAGTGIYSVDAKYYVGDYCSSTFYPCPAASIKQSTFDHLDYGINSSNSDPLINMTVNHAKFTYITYDGVHLAGVNYPSINNNSFDVGPNSYENCGLYLDFCKYFSVQNNQFFSTTGGYVGIYVKDSKTGAHEIYRNTFTGLVVGIIPLNDNSGTTNYSDGLTMHCNTFTGNNYDIGVTGVDASSGITSPASIAFVQGINIPGSPQALVRNKYSAICGSENKFYIDNSTKGVIHACNSDLSTQPLPQPSCSDLLVNIILSTVNLNYSADCADKLNDTKGRMSEKISELGNSVAVLKQTYNNLIDGGNTSSLVASVNSNMSPGILKNLLMSKSPYLSDQVLSAYISKSETPPNGNLKDVIIANSPVTADVKIKLDALNLPNGIANQINAAQHGISARLTKEAQIIQTAYDQQLYISDKIRLFLNDTISTNPMDSVLSMLKTYPRKDVSCDLIQAYSTKGDYSKANSIIDSLDAINKLDDYCRFQKLLIELKQAQEKCYKLKTDAVIKAKVEVYANDCEKESCPNAQALLKEVFNYQYPILRMLPENNRSMIYQNSDPTKEDGSLLSLYPNPANELLNIMFNDNESETGIIEIRNVLGELVDKIQLKNSDVYQYNTQGLNKSIYFVSLYVNNKLVENKKLILIK